MEKEFIMPDVMLDLTDENLTLEEAIAKCEKARQEMLNTPWYKRIFKPIKRSLNK